MLGILVGLSEVDILDIWTKTFLVPKKKKKKKSTDSTLMISQELIYNSCIFSDVMGNLGDYIMKFHHQENLISG